MKNQEFNVKAVKKGIDGSFTASLYLNSKKVASVRSEGQFVNCLFDWKDDKFKKDFDEFIKKQPQRIVNEGFEQIQFVEDADSFIADLLSIHERYLWVQNLLKTSTVFRLKNDGADEYNIYDEPFSEEIKQRIIRENGDNLLEILNEK